MSSAILVENLTKKYKKAPQPAVDNVSFSVDEGEFFAFLGPNGAGKTTTISILTTLLSKSAGRVEIAGADIDKDPTKVRSQIGIIFQNPSLDLNLSAEENIRFHAVLYGIYPFRPTFKCMPKEYQDKVMYLAEVLGIKKDINKQVKAFSGGMKRKLEILRSLMHSPKILFLDEPTTGLDPLSRKNLWEYLLNARKVENTTIFLTTHYLEEAENVDRLAIINQGQIVAHGSPAKIKHQLVKDSVLVDANPRQKLIAELDAKRVDYSVVTEGVCIPLSTNHTNPQHVIKQIDTELTVLDIRKPSLEEAYLEIIGANEQRD